MLHKVRFTETKGKTVKTVDLNSSTAVMTFEDGTYSQIEIEHDKYGDFSSLRESAPLGLDLDQFGHCLVHRYHVTLGIITEEELKAVQQKAKEWTKATMKDHETRERREYERLKKKFES